MRLWHKDLIEVLPRQQLIAQWRECCCIARNIAVNGTPNHILVNKILNYSEENFLNYTHLVLLEMEARGYNINQKSLFYFYDNVKIGSKYFSQQQDTSDLIYEYWHNDRYFWQCFHNLEEKYDCGGIPESEWELLLEKVEELYFGKK